MSVFFTDHASAGYVTARFPEVGCLVTGMIKSFWLRLACILGSAVVLVVVPWFIAVPFIAVFMPEKRKEISRIFSEWSASLFS